MGFLCDSAGPTSFLPCVNVKISRSPGPKIFPQTPQAGILTFGPRVYMFRMIFAPTKHHRQSFPLFGSGPLSERDVLPSAVATGGRVGVGHGRRPKHCRSFGPERSWVMVPRHVGRLGLAALAAGASVVGRAPERRREDQLPASQHHTRPGEHSRRHEAFFGR